MQNTAARRATPDDLDAVATLFDQYRQFYDQAPNREAARTFIAARMANAESVIWVGLDAQDHIAGFCQLYPSFCSVAAAQGVARMDLTTAHNNSQAQALYESLGWQMDTVFRAYNWTPQSVTRTA